MQWQRHGEASDAFAKAVALDPSRDDYYLLLGLSRQNAGELTGAMQAFDAGIALQGVALSRLYLYRGNLRSSTNLQGAIEDYNQVELLGGTDLSFAFLNRGNLYLRSKNYDLAIPDYENYLILEPNSPQEAQIRELLTLLRNQLAQEAEQARLEAERERLLEEARRLEEARKAEEEARRAALMEQVLQSLSDSGEDTTNIGAGTENIREDFEESDLED